MRRKCHKCFEKAVDGRNTYSIESVAKFSMIHRDERSANSAAFADAKMQMVAEYWAQQFNQRSPPEHKVAFVVAQVLELLGRLNREFEKTILMVTHDPHAAQKAQSIVHLDKGSLGRIEENAPLAAGPANA